MRPDGAARKVAAFPQETRAVSDRPPTEPPPRDGGTAHPYLLLVLTVLFWAGNVIAGRFMADTAPPITLAFCRWSLALVLVLPFGLAHLRDTARRLAPHRRLVAVLGLLQQALERTGGNRTQAAALLGMSFRQFRYRLAKHDPAGTSSGADEDNSEAD